MTERELRMTCKRLLWAIETGDGDTTRATAASVRAKLAADEAELDRQGATGQWLARAERYASPDGEADVVAFAAVGHRLTTDDFAPHLTVAEAARLLGVGTDDVSDLITQAELAAVRSDDGSPLISRLSFNALRRRQAGLSASRCITDEHLLRALAAFEAECGASADAWLLAWRRGALPHTGANDALALRAQALLRADTVAAGSDV